MEKYAHAICFGLIWGKVDLFEKFRHRERKRTGRGGGNINKSRKVYLANYIYWMGLVYENKMRCFNFGHRSAHNSYEVITATSINNFTHTSTTDCLGPPGPGENAVVRHRKERNKLGRLTVARVIG